MTTERNDFLRHMEDLADRAERQSVVTASSFLTPAEQYEVSRWAQRRTDCVLLLHGGQDGCERKRAFFLPDWMPPEELDLHEYIRAVKLTAYYGEPGHRDYLGAALALGIQRASLGDIHVLGAEAYLFCLPGIAPLLQELDRVGRVSVRADAVSLDDVPVPQRQVKQVSFTVKSPRLDAIVSSMFGLSRTQAAELIRLGAASLNYSPCEKADAPVREGDVISLRGKGKGVVTAIGGRSRKDRLFLSAEIWL